MQICIQCGQDLPGAGWACAACGFRPPEEDSIPLLAQDLTNGTVGYDPAHYHDLAAIEDEHFWFAARRVLITGALRRYFPAMSRFLEVGCGTGAVLQAVHRSFGDAEVTGSEIFTEGLAFARERIPTARLVQMDARHIPYRDHFDAIGLFDVLEHIEDDGQVLGEVYAALRTGGGLVVTVPQHRWLWSAQDEVAGHVRRYTRRELVQTVEAAGFTVRCATSFVSLLLPVLWASRMRSRRFGQAAAEEFEVSGALNRVFARVMTAERWLIDMGLRFPAGGSLLLVAGKG